MERVCELTQQWEGNEAGAQVVVHQDTYDLLLQNDMGKEVSHEAERTRLTELAQKQAEQEAERVAELGISKEHIKRLVDQALADARSGADSPPNLSLDTKDVKEKVRLCPVSTKLGWQGTEHWWHAAANACRRTQPVVDPRLLDESIQKVTGFHEEGDDTLGGYLVPDDVRLELLKERLENTIVRANGARVIPTMRDQVVLTRIDDASHATSVFGNVVFYWIAEQAALTLSNLVFGKIQIPVEKLAGYCHVTRELLADAFVSVEAEIRQNFSEGAAWFEDYYFLNGTGAGQPKGILQSGAIVNVARAGALAIAWADIAGMYARQRFPGRAVWVANQATLPQLLQMTGGTEVIWIGLSQGATDAPPGTLLGRPIRFTEKVPTLGSTGDLNFLDITHYIIADRENIRIDRSDDLRFATDEVSLRFILRVGGRSRTDVAFTPRNGNTLSPYVVLQ